MTAGEYIQAFLADPHVGKLSLWCEDRKERTFSAVTWCVSGHGTHHGARCSGDSLAKALRGAVDYLVHEWARKPACGGVSCAGAIVAMKAPPWRDVEPVDELTTMLAAVFESFPKASSIVIERTRGGMSVSVHMALYRGSIMKMGPDIRTAIARMLTFIDTMKSAPEPDRFAIKPSPYAPIEERWGLP